MGSLETKVIFSRPLFSTSMIMGERVNCVVFLFFVLFFSVFENVCRKFANPFFSLEKNAEIHAEVMMKE